MPAFLIIKGREEHIASFREGESLLAVLQREGFSVNAPCGGKGKCGRCLVKVVTKGEARSVPACKTPAADGIRLIIEDGNDDLSWNAAGTLAAGKAGSAPGELGAAVDLGTTSIAVSLFDLSSGQKLGMKGEWNEQRSHGADVISRIGYTMEHADGLKQLSDTVQKQILRMIDALCRENGRKSEDLKTVFLAGNTTMQHLFARISPESIAAAPFEPQSYFDSPVPFSLPGKEIMLTPCVSGYVGGDIVSGMYALGLDKAEGRHLFLDVGTNGEMALGGKDGFLTCAVACGPAFEGAGISCGMPASAGAISRVWCEGDSLCYEVIGGGEATGLCGSGLLDLAACLTELGYISPDGRLFGDEDENGRAVFPLTEHVVLTAGDVRQLQLAKAAVAAGIRILLEDSGVSYDEIDTLYLAGGFGTRLNPKSAAALGMLPEELLGKVRSAGNASLLGMETALLSGGERRLLAVRNMCDYTELSTHSRFSETFVEEMLFPSDGEWDD